MSTQITLTNFIKGRVKASTMLDHIEQKLLEQGCVSKNSHGNCAYRGVNGVKCGIGHIIPDSVYRSGMDDPDSEDNSIAGILTRFKSHLKLDDVNINSDHLSFLADIQNSHDGMPNNVTRFKQGIKQRFKSLREEYAND